MSQKMQQYQLKLYQELLITKQMLQKQQKSKYWRLLKNLVLNLIKAPKALDRKSPICLRYYMIIPTNRI